LSFSGEHLLTKGPHAAGDGTFIHSRLAIPRSMQTQKLTIKQTATGYWTVQRGAVHLAGAMTRRGAEAERELLRRLSRRNVRRTAPRADASS
jgi:hypothetical protein